MQEDVETYDSPDASDQREDIYIGNHIPCSESFSGYCIHGKCEFIYSTQKASCRCESGYTGQHCEKTDFSILYVVPSRQKLTHVLIAAIIGAVQIAIIVAIVMCITRQEIGNFHGNVQALLDSPGVVFHLLSPSVAVLLVNFAKALE
ncbi:hypothetical protein JD844_016944 [Phrynosoma platyrhinos]|uniref:EGF-like domain-containing protein n=1 Tax=Phrynosoma platyrhinos TaxID=52577 RepID=A0ABQ7SL79_PHRPL|nr:hypothetical protein JD844_016944 [Phrynosoma platyrhinos]